jgi:2,3-bisphosphoglycerate-dependent phosphoglycerate mutase
MDICFLRHGRSRADDEEVHEGRYDSPLTGVGRAQATRLGAMWKQQDVEFDLIVCSTLVRAHETAEIVADALGVPVEPDANWMEKDNGPLAGLTWEEADAQYPEPEWNTPYVRLAGVGESPSDLQCRATRAIQDVIHRGRERVLVVAHGGILNAAMRSISGAPAQVNKTSFYFGFGDNGYVRTTYTPESHSWGIREFVPNGVDSYKME